MKIKTLLVALALLGAFLAYAQQTQAQNPVVDLGAKGAAAVGGGLNAVIQTCINTIGASGGLLGAILSVVLSMLNGLISLVMSALAAVGLGGVAGFCAGAIMGCISGIVGLISAGIVEILDILQAAGRGIDALCTGVGGLIIVFIADIILMIWQVIGMIVLEIWNVISLFGYGLGGIFATCFMAIPIVAMATGIVGAVLSAVQFAILAVIWVLGIGLPAGAGAVITGGVAVWSGEGWYIPILHLADFTMWTVYLAIFLPLHVAFGATGFGTASWIGGLGGGYVWVANTLAAILELIFTLIVAIISLILFVLRWYSILPTCYRFCVNTLC